MVFRVSDTVAVLLALDDARARREQGLVVRWLAHGCVITLPDLDTARCLLEDLEYRASGNFSQDPGETRAARAAANRLRVAIRRWEAQDRQLAGRK